MKIKYFLIILALAIVCVGCGKKGGNPVLNYLKNSELKFDNKQQRDNIFRACSDALKVSSDDLKTMRYPDDQGVEDQWDLQTLFTKRFIPKKPGLSWGDNFYKDIKQDSVESILSKILISY